MKNRKTKITLFLALFLMLTLFAGFGTAAEGNAVENAKASVLTYEGMLARTTGDSGIRSMFRIDKAALAVLEEDGYTVEIGASMGVAVFGGVSYNALQDLTVVADAEKGYVCEASGVGTVVVYSSDEEATYATNKYVSQNGSEYKFAFTTRFSEQYENATYYNAEFCYRGFVALTKDGVTVLNYVDADGEKLGNSISLYDIVKHFVSGDYTGDKAEEYATLPKFLAVVDAVEIIEYFPKDDAGAADKLLSDGETLHVTKESGHAFTVNVACGGIYAVKMKYNAQNLKVDAVKLTNGSFPNAKVSGGIIFPDILTYGTTPTDFIVPDADKVGAYQPDSSVAAMSAAYSGEGFLYVYLGAGENSLLLETGSSAGLGIYAMQFVLLDELALDDRTIYSEFIREDNGEAYNTVRFPSNSAGTPNLQAIYTTLTLSAGVYRASGLFQVSQGAEITLELLSDDSTLGTASYKQSNKLTLAPGTDYFAYLSLGNGFTVPASGEYKVRISRSNTSSNIALSEIYLTKVKIIPEEIGTPTVTVDGDGVASWEAVKGATAYEYKINGGAATVTTSTNVLLQNCDDLTVRALGNGKEYLDSDWSEPVKYIQTTFTVDLATDLTASNGLTLEAEGTYAGYYNLPVSDGTDYIEFKVTAGTAGLYAIHIDGMATGSGYAQLYMTNTTDKGDGWVDHSTVASIKRNRTATLDGLAVGYQYLYAGENTLRFHLNTDNAALLYFKTVQLSLYWEDTSAAKQIISRDVVSNIKQSASYSGQSRFRDEAGVLYLQGKDDNTAGADIALPRVSEAADYTVYMIGTHQMSSPVTITCSNGQTVNFQPSSNPIELNDSPHFGEAYLYEVGTLTLKNNVDYTITLTVPYKWISIHTIYLVKTGEYSGEKETLLTPVLSVSGTGTVSWEAIPYADGYEYILDGGEPVVTDETSLILKNGQTFTVRAIGSGAYASSEYSDLLTYVPAPATEWEYDLANTDLYTKSETLSYADGYLYMPAGEANYIEFTVNAAKAGFYDISYIGKSVDRARLKHINVTATEDGWSSHTAIGEFSEGKTQETFTRTTAQYLSAGSNTIRIYVYDGNYYASHVKIELMMEEPENTVHMVVNSSNSSVLTPSAKGGDGFNRPSEHGTTGVMWGRSGSQLAFTLPRFEEGGVYKVYAVGANASTDKVSFDLVCDGATVGSTSFRNTKAATHYHQVNVYEIGELTLSANADYTLVAYPNGNWFGFHRFFFVKVGDVPNEMHVGDLSVDAVGDAVSAKVFLSGADYHYLTMALYDAEGNILRAAYREKSNETQLFTLSLNLAESEVAAFDSVRIFPTAEKNSLTPIDEDAVYCYFLDDSVTATAYTADKESGSFAATVNVTSFHYDYVALVLLNESGNAIASAHAEVPEYTATGMTLSATVSPAVAETVTEMKVIVTESGDSDEAVSGTTSFTYRFANDLRLLFVSDLHYSVMQGATGRYTNINGLSGDGRAQHLVDSILAENEAGGIDAVFLLGDLTSSEDWYKRFDPNCANHHYSEERDVWNSSTNSAGADGILNLDDYYGSKYDAVYQLQTKYLSQLEEAGIPVYCVPGNHDTIDNGHWERTFGYKEKFGYTETEYIVRFLEQKTAVVMLNTFDTSNGAMDTPRTSSEKTYRNGKEQTLGYTPVKEELLIALLDELVSEGYESVYIAAHDMTTADAALLEAAEKYSFITAYMYGDHHVDTVGTIGGEPAFIEGHYVATLFEYVGENGERLYNHQRLPLSYVIAEKHGDVATVDYKKMEVVHLAKDNYDFMARYFVLTEVDARDENTVILTRITDTTVSDDGKTTNTVYAGYYHLTLRTDLSDEDLAAAERIAWLVETYDICIFTFSQGNTGIIPDGMKTSTETWWTDANGEFEIEGGATDWCYNDLQVSPDYTSFYREKVIYKSYEIVDNGDANLTFVDESEVTSTVK